MKKFFTCLFSILVAYTLMSQDITVEFDFPSVVNNGKYIELQYDNCFNVTAPGSPVIPVYQYNFLEKQNNINDKIVIKSVEYYDKTVEGRIIPAAKPQPLSMLSDVVDMAENPLIYNSKSAYPSESVKSGLTQFLRGHGITSFMIYPAVYFPADNITKCIKKITFTHIAKAQKSEMAAYNDAETIKRVYDVANDVSALSSYSYKMNDKGTNYDLLVITCDSLLPYINTYINFKTSQGYYVATETVEHIYSAYQGNDKQEMIRNCVKDYYNNSGISYLLLCGDADVAVPTQNVIPCRGMTAQGDPFIPADLYYSNLDGNWNDNGNDLFGEDGEGDYYGELSVGRICADNGTEINNFINKLLLYQLSPVVDEVENALLIGEILNSDDVTYGGTYMDEIATGTSHHGFTTAGIPDNINIFKLYDRDKVWSSADVFDYYSKKGVHFVNHLGHSNVDYNMKMSNGSLTTKNFTNDGIKHSLVAHYSQGCYNGSFDNRSTTYGGWGSGDCFAEVFTTLPTGHVAAIANSRYGWYMPGNTNSSSQFYNRLYVDGVYNKGYYKIGDANRYSKEKYTGWLSDYDGDNFRFVFYETNLFGDPSMEIWTAKPIPVTADMLGALPNNLDNWKIKTNAPNAIIAIVKDNVLIYRDTADNSGQCIVDFKSLHLSTGDTVEVHIRAHNMIPMSKTLGILSFTPVIDYTCTFSDEQGNNDGKINYGDKITLNLNVKNISTAPFPGGAVTLTCDKSFVKILNPTFNIQGLAAGESTPVDGIYAYVNPDDAVSGYVTFTFDLGNGITYNSYTYVYAPIIKLERYSITEKTGNGDGFLQQGETGTLSLTYSNKGLYNIKNVQLALVKNDVIVQYPVTQISSSALSIGDSITYNFDFTVGNCEDGFIIHFLPEFKDEMNLDYKKEICYMIGNSKILIVDLDKNTNSMSELNQDLYNVIGANVNYVKSLLSQAEINSYPIVFLSLGVFNDNTVLNNDQQQILINYLENGGNLYLESGSLWFHDHNYGLKDYFSLEGTATEESWTKGFSEITGVEDSHFESFDFGYDGDNLRIDNITPVNNAIQLFVNSPVQFGGSVGYHADKYNTIASSFEYGGLVEKNEGDRQLFAKKILEFFGMNIIGPKTIDLPSDTVACLNSIITLDAGDGFVSYKWSTGDTTRVINISISSYESESSINVTLQAVDAIGYLASKSVDIAIKSCTGIDNYIAVDDLVVYPNPTDGKITLKFAHDTDNCKVYVYNVSQQLVYSSNVNNGSTIDLQNVPAGIYFIKVVENSNIVIKKIIKQ